MHLPAPQQTVSKLAGLLAPGGVLVVSDAVDLTTDSTPLTPYTRAMRAMWQGLRDSIGTDVSQVPHRAELLRAAGLEPVAAEIHVPPLVAGSAISRFWADTWQRARAAMVATGLIDDAGLDEAVRYLDSPGAPDCRRGCSRPGGGSPRPRVPVGLTVCDMPLSV